MILCFFAIKQDLTMLFTGTNMLTIWWRR